MSSQRQLELITTHDPLDEAKTEEADCDSLNMCFWLFLMSFGLLCKPPNNRTTASGFGAPVLSHLETNRDNVESVVKDTMSLINLNPINGLRPGTKRMENSPGKKAVQDFGKKGKEMEGDPLENLSCFQVLQAIQRFLQSMYIGRG